MCDERERLIGYVYDECEGDDRAEIDRHLETCAVCRDEIAGLRATRQDLLAWEVPDHGSVWRPFAPARETPWYREVPAWAMAAAASVMFLIGVGGSVAANVVLRPALAAPVAQVQAPAQPAVDQTLNEAAAIRAEMAALEARIRSSMRTSNAQFTQRISEGSVEHASLIESDRTISEQMRVNGVINAMWNKLQKLEDRNRLLEQELLRITTGSGVLGR